MNWIDWLGSAAFSTLAISVIAWLSRTWIATRLTSSIRYEFDEKIESLKSDLRQKEAQVEALRSGGLAAMIARQSKLEERRILAIEELWSAFHSLGPLRKYVVLLSAIDFDEALQSSSRDADTRRLFTMVGGDGTKDIPPAFTLDVWKPRPFVSEAAWILISVYQATLSVAALRYHQLRVGIDGDFTNFDQVILLLQMALPDLAESIREKGASFLPKALTHLEERLLTELKNMLGGRESDDTNFAQVKAILQKIQSENE
ncbi:MAG: hypothetical protein J0H09_04010 [Burkholderiales bacterium]|nr:hypothetical protein [Burkholderiales bacterium]